jgi:hypothetical protein
MSPPPPLSNPQVEEYNLPKRSGITSFAIVCLEVAMT